MNKKSIEYIEFITSRKSIRNFIYEDINKEIIENILECGRWAPSGMNTQPWNVCIVQYPSLKKMLGELTKYSGIIESAYYDLFIFLDLDRGYNRVKDIQAIGAFMENILLGTHAMGLGAVWIGEILNNKEKVNEFFELSTEKYELMGVIAIGAIDEQLEEKKKHKRERRPLEDFVEWY
ncbi:MAG: nitroreductase family protein [Promethearchaeota archaeon]|nr:MAG: nitroreductase family protein [Candidatus Lokiarchaeota archaeon]